MKKALVCGAGGFIGTHLVRRLKKEGYWVRGADIKKPEYSKTLADEFIECDLTKRSVCRKILKGGFDEVYQLSADRGGVGYMKPKECEMMTTNVLINTYMIIESVKAKVGKYFYASSACVYRDMGIGDIEMPESGVYPAYPQNEYGWEKLYSERVLQAHHRKYGMDFRIARFQTVYGEESVWQGGKEKAIDALCRKVVLSKNGILEVWGDGTAIRAFTYIEDLINAIRCLMKSDITTPVNIGSPERVNVAELARLIIKVSGKKLKIKFVEGEVGVQSRNFSNDLIYTTGWKPKFTLEQGLKRHYKWIKKQIKNER